ncbi:hypothetical protein [Gottfriedia acidiceleris]|uniref:Uncharacterized protein n=1 Tax=Gottfriedia acidiceleris TaxID=371036 RepID=A0ABY4JLW6_9BACI|nr:hypothetical protein [Gottfriedia acidiceleris]UPM54844.1 hypothetical protein MY490_02935 [Gottfriedia acidiceleris]
MIKIIKIFSIIAGVITVLALAGYYTLDFLFRDMCGNEITQKELSPKGDKVAYIFERNCGATTGYSYHLMDSDQKLTNKSGNTFVSDDFFKISWINNKKIQVNYPKSTETYEMDRHVNGTKIVYVSE